MAQITDRVPQLVLEAIDHASTKGTYVFTGHSVMEAIRKKNGQDQRLKMQILTYFNDLLRHGTIGMRNVGMGDSQWQEQVTFFVTESGKELLAQATRDPLNPTGYIAYLNQETKIDPVTRGYVEEALQTYLACCYKATAVLIGAAVENLTLGLRDDLVKGLRATGQTVPAKVTAWQAKTVLEAVAEIVLRDLATDVKHTKDEANRKLLEEAEAKLSGVASEFRKTRNDAGHPASLDPVHSADVHCNLLLFPATAKLIGRLRAWIVGYYV